MKILLLGEYSNVHHTLALGLRALGHDVTVASNGDGWKNYPRDIDLKRQAYHRLGSFSYFFKIIRIFRLFKGYDVVQIINPIFLDLKAENILPFYKYLRKYNKIVIMGAFGMDYYYIKACLDFKTFKYSDFNFENSERISEENEIFKRDWLHGSKGKLNKLIVEDCDAIVAGLYEYAVAYQNHMPYPEKLTFIPFPIILPSKSNLIIRERKKDAPVKLFIGIQAKRSVYKGTDIMLRAAQRIVHDYPNACELHIASNIPFNEYKKMLNASEVILDQLYSYTPAMNALEAMAHGLINVGGAEPENYEILHEKELRPIINVQPNEQSVYKELKNLILHRNELIPILQKQALSYIARHHEYCKVAKQYEKLYYTILKRNGHYV